MVVIAHEGVSMEHDAVFVNSTGEIAEESRAICLRQIDSLRSLPLAVIDMVRGTGKDDTKRSALDAS